MDHSKEGEASADRGAGVEIPAKLAGFRFVSIYYLVYGVLSVGLRGWT